MAKLKDNFSGNFNEKYNKKKEEFIDDYMILVNQARKIINGNDFIKFKTMFKHYEKSIIKKMISCKKDNKDETYNFFVTCITKLEVFYDIFEPLEDIGNSKI